MRLLLDETHSHEPGALLDEVALAELYAAPEGPWLRANFVSTLDGAATGADGRSGSINTAADGIVFHLLRRLSDVVVVGAGTARTEGYDRIEEVDGTAPPLALVSNTARVPGALAAPSPGRGEVLMVTHAAAPATALAEARNALGADGVLLCGDSEVDVNAMRRELERRGLPRILAEGGPSLFGTMLAAGVVDELDLTWSPKVVGGDQRRIVSGPPVNVPLAPLTMVEGDGTVMGRWRVLRG